MHRDNDVRDQEGRNRLTATKSLWMRASRGARAKPQWRSRKQCGHSPRAVEGWPLACPKNCGGESPQIECRIAQFAKTTKFELVEEFRDEGVSGTRDSRPGLAALLDP